MNADKNPCCVVFLDRQTIPAYVALRQLPFPHRWRMYDRSTTGDVAGRIRDADIVVVNKVRITRDDIEQAKNLKLIAVAATGTDNIDIKACVERGIVVSNIRGYAGNSVPEHTFALIFALRRSIAAYRQAVAQGRWEKAGQFCFFDFPIRDLRGSTLGIIGSGALGGAVAGMARALGVNVLLAGRKVIATPALAGRARRDQVISDLEKVPFEALLEQSDIISLHCPLTPETHHLIGAADFARMKRRPLLINTARGGLVDEQALVTALQQGQISGAGFDVVSSEPLSQDHPFNAVLDHPAFILTPHVAWASEEAIRALADQLIDNISAFQRGEPRNIVTPG
jgi:glycerate dehydrogenase